MNFQTIEHAFFVSGHSQNEGDSMHSTIEKASRNIPVYTPSQWAQLIRTAKRNPPPYVVKELDLNDFLDFKSVANMLQNFEFDIQREKIKWLKVKRFIFKSTSPNTVQVYYDYGESFLSLNLLKKKYENKESKCARSPKHYPEKCFKKIVSYNKG